MRVLNKNETCVIVAILEAIDKELKRCYWNKNQTHMDSPFDNSGSKYECKAFSARAYDWVNDNGDNFVYPKDNLHVEWYKHCGRGIYVEVPDDWTMERLPDMLADCIAAIREDFGDSDD